MTQEQLMAAYAGLVLAHEYFSSATPNTSDEEQELDDVKKGTAKSIVFLSRKISEEVERQLIENSNINT